MARRPPLGQHFLRDDRFVRLAVEHAGIDATDDILEVGPGKGILTRALSRVARRVYAIELDPLLADKLQAENLVNVEIIRGDAVQVAWPRFSACVSNLPYQISSPFLFRLLSLDFRVAVLLLQKEFADRLVAKPDTSEYGRLSVNAQRKARIELLARVPPGAFDPPPKVDSALVKITPRAATFDAPPNYDEVVERAFGERRKKLANALGAKDVPYGDRRAGELTPAQFAEVAAHLAQRRRV